MCTTEQELLHEAISEFMRQINDIADKNFKAGEPYYYSFTHEYYNSGNAQPVCEDTDSFEITDPYDLQQGPDFWWECSNLEDSIREMFGNDDIRPEHTKYWVWTQVITFEFWTSPVYDDDGDIIDYKETNEVSFGFDADDVWRWKCLEEEQDCGDFGIDF